MRWPWSSKAPRPTPMPWPTSFRMTGEIRSPRVGEWFYSTTHGAAFLAKGDGWLCHPIVQVTDEAWLREWGPKLTARIEEKR